MKHVTLLVAGLLMAAAFVLAGCGQQPEPAGGQAAIDRFRQVGEARASGDANGVVRIGEQVVTLDDFREGVRIVETNLEYMKGEISKGSFDSSFLQEFVQLIERTGVQTVALGSLIQDRALYERAVANGFSATDQEVTARLERDRELFRVNPEVAQVNAYIEAVGQDRYWSELYPAVLRREMAIQKMWEATVTGITDQGSRDAKWNDVQKQATSSVSIEALAPGAIAPATVSNALAYLDKYRQLPR